MKFDTIFDEYIEKRKKFDSVKANAAVADAAGGGDSKKNETEALKNKIIVIQKNFEIEMKHAKDVASKNALELVTAKLAESRYTYEEELENISRQFEEMQQEVSRLKEDKIGMKREIVKLEGVIQELNAMVETTGYYQAQWEKRQDMNEKQEKEIRELEAKKAKNEIPQKALEMFTGAQSVLAQEFNFYSFSVMINGEQSKEIMD